MPNLQTFIEEKVKEWTNYMETPPYSKDMFHDFLRTALREAAELAIRETDRIVIPKDIGKVAFRSFVDELNTAQEKAKKFLE